MRVIVGFWRFLVAVKDGLVLLLLLLFFGLLYAALSMAPKPQSVASSGALQIALDGALVEQPAQASPVQTLSGSLPLSEYRLHDLVRALEAAATDLRIKAVVLDLDSFTGGSQAAIAAAGRAADKVRAAGKPVLAFATGYTDDGYQLAAHASEIWLDPMGAVLIAGPGGTGLYYKGLFDKLGVAVDVYRVGTYKSAVEPYTREDQSPDARAASQALADTLWARWQADVAAARPKVRLADYVARPEQLIQQAGNTAQAALEAGLVDKLGDRIAFGQRVAQIVGPAASRQAGGYQAVPLETWIAGHPGPRSGSPIGIVTIAGTIVDGEAPPGTAGGETIANLILDELAKDRIKALVVRIDSPGGSALAAERMRSAILQAKAKGLPVIVSMGGLAASGGYWVATPGDMIFAEPSTITGSIGVFGLLPSFRGTLEKLGIGADGVKTTPLSGEPDLLRGTSPEFDRLAQIGVEDIYRRFTGIVAASRKLPIARVDAIGQGRVWAGDTAKTIGLVDAFGGLDAAIAEAARRAKLDPGQVYPLFIERKPSLFSQLLTSAARDGMEEAGLAARSEAPRDALSRLVRRPEERLGRLVADMQLMARGPAVQAYCLACPVMTTPAPPVHDGVIGRLVSSLFSR